MLIEMMKKLLLMIAPSLGSHAKPEKYRPERHYMRGPGPKASKAKARSSQPGEPDRAEA